MKPSVKRSHRYNLLLVSPTRRSPGSLILSDFVSIYFIKGRRYVKSAKFA